MPEHSCLHKASLVEKFVEEPSKVVFDVLTKSQLIQLKSRLYVLQVMLKHGEVIPM